MTPRFHLDDAPLAPSASATPDAPKGFKRDAETYFPSNGSLLLAAA